MRVLYIAILIALFAISPVSSEEMSRQRYAIIVQNVGPGLARNLQSLLIDSNWEKDNILCYGRIEPSTPFSPLCLGEPTSDNYLAGIDSIAQEITDRDTLLVVFICHMTKGFLINNTLSGEQLNTSLSGIPDGATIVAILEGCHTAALIPGLTAVDLVYASAGPDQACYGGWMHFFLEAMGTDHTAYSLADLDGDGFVSFGEAYDYAADERRLADWYAALSPDVWPSNAGYPTPARTEGDLQYCLFLDPDAMAPF
jgi:hypothetical protein